MSEVDIFLDLLDDKEIDTISKSMGIPVQNKSNREVNKIRLKQKFKTGNKSFNKFIAQNRDDSLSKFTENEYLIFLKYFSQKGYSDDRKFVNFLSYFPDKAENMLHEMEENTKENKYVFDFDILFEESDIVGFFNKSFNIFDKKYIMDMADFIIRFMLKEELINFENIDIKKIKNYGLNDFLESIKNTSSAEEELIIKYFYIKTHKVEEPLYSQLLLHIYYYLLILCKPYLEKAKDVQKNNILIHENEKLKKAIKKYEGMEKEVENYIEKNKQTKNIIDEQKREIASHKSAIQELENQILIANTEHSDTVNKLQNNYDSIMKDYHNIKELSELYASKLDKFNSYFDSFSNDTCIAEVVVISCFDRYLIKKLYKDEVIFLSSDEANKNKVLNVPESVKFILIERFGIESDTIIRIKKQFENKDNIVSIINPDNDRDLLEEIIKIKQDSRREF